MKFTVVTVCYNAEKCIEDTMRSVLNQTHIDIEYLIIDGLSKDHTIDIVNCIAKEYRSRNIRVIAEKDQGIYDAMNKGITKATGEYINFMNAGDSFYTNDVIEKVAKMADKTADVIFGDEVSVFDGKLCKVLARPFYEHLPLHQSMGFNHQCSFVKCSTAKRYLFDLKYRLAADYNMMITIFRNSGVFQHLDLPIALYDTNGASYQHIRLHSLETLNIDYPERIIINKILAYKKYLRYKYGQMAKKIVLSICPWVVHKKHILNDRIIPIDKI